MTVIFLRDAYSRTSQDLGNYGKMTSRLLSGDSGHINISNAESSEGALEKSFDYILKKPFRASELGSLFLWLKHRITKRRHVAK